MKKYIIDLQVLQSVLNLIGKLTNPSIPLDNVIPVIDALRNLPIHDEPELTNEPQ